MWEQPVGRKALESPLTASKAFATLELVTELPGAGRAVMSVSGRAIVWGGGERMFLLAIEDVSALRAAVVRLLADWKSRGSGSAPD
jgi:hypothetical protein